MGDIHARAPTSIALYEWIFDGGIEKGAKVVSLCKDSQFIVGYDTSVEPILDPEIKSRWGTETESYYTVALDETVDQNYEFMKRKGIEYVALGASCVFWAPVAEQQEYGQKLQTRLNEMAEYPNFILVHNTESEALFRVG